MIHGYALPSLPLSQAKLISGFWKCDLNLIERLHVCRAPSAVENLVLSMEAFNRYGDALEQVPGFFKDGYRQDFWRLDLDEKLADCGFIVPITDRTFGFYTSLQVFRHARDLNPFVLTTRERERGAA
jgi:hypothetical protein